MKRGGWTKRPVAIDKIKQCAWCDNEFSIRQPCRFEVAKFCSHKCQVHFQRDKVIKAYPPKDEVTWLYAVEGLSDVELGKHYGHSYQWAFLLRRHYGIEARAAGSHSRKPLERKSDRARWGMHLKPEEACRNCGREGLLLSLHHAIPRSVCKASKYDLRNGVPLCTRCHLGWHRRHIPLYRDIFTEGEWAYLTSVELTGQRIEAWLDDRYPERPAAARAAA